MALLLLLGSAAQPLAAAPQAPDVPPPKPVPMLVLGDSYSSGEGMYTIKGPCAQSTSAYGPYAARLPEMDEYVEDAVDFHACTGALSRFVDDKDEPDPVDLPEQITAASRSGKRYGLIAMTIGGNDIGFADVIEQCVLHRISNTFGDTPLEASQRRRSSCPVTEDLMNVLVDKLGARLPEIYDRVSDKLLEDGGYLAVLGYPRLFEEPSRWSGLSGLADSCGAFQAHDAAMFRRVADRLNTTISDAVDKATSPGVEYVGVSLGFEGHNLCGEEEWLNGLWSIWNYILHRGKFRTNVAMHPNFRGHQYEAKQLARAVAKFDWSAYGKPTTPPSTVTPKPPGQPQVICDEAQHKRACVHTDILTGSADAAGMGHGPYTAPRKMYVGSNLVLQGLEWKDWGKATARARGWTASTDCDPNCGEGKADRQDVEVEITKLVDTRDLRQYTCARARKEGQGWDSLGVERVCLKVKGNPVGG
ncbi:SGNH/GDSL hydrolase family protein [Streptomyces boninensis]|uniref:SGNH/GDSL hydrolase family protein n=1 Tax=Streptomyces boninensis TaxID=2039455 RepID=UPI003B227589